METNNIARPVDSIIHLLMMGVGGGGEDKGVQKLQNLCKKNV